MPLLLTGVTLGFLGRAFLGAGPMTCASAVIASGTCSWALAGVVLARAALTLVAVCRLLRKLIWRTMKVPLLLALVPLVR